MSLKEPMKKQNKNNWTNLPKNAKKQFNFNRNHQCSSFKTMNYIDPNYNNVKLSQKKKPPHLLHDSRSSSTINFFPNGKAKNSLSFYPLDIRMAPLNKTNKHIDNHRLHNKSAIDIIKIPKTNTNKNNIIHKVLKMKTKKNKESKNINYVISAYNISAKNTYFGDFMKKIINNKSSNNNNNGTLSNSMNLINNNNPNSINMPGLETINNLNVGINKNEMLEKAQKEKERLNELLNEKIKNSQKINERIKELENKNKSSVQKINKVQKKNDNLSSTLDKIIKLMKLLKSNGFDIPEILNNLSNYEEEDYEKNKKEEKEESENTLKDFSFKLNDQLNINEDSNMFDNINLIEKDKDKNNDKVNIKKIANMNKKNSKLKEHEEFSFRNNKKIISHSVGDE
jgi:hypothetical protein